MFRRALRDKADLATLKKLQETVKAHTVQIEALRDAIVAVNAKTQRFNTTLTDFAGGAGTVDVDVTWPQEWPDTGYMVLTPLPITGPLAIGKVFPALKAFSKTTTGCVVTVVATQAVATCGLEVLGVRTMTS